MWSGINIPWFKRIYADESAQQNKDQLNISNCCPLSMDCKYYNYICIHHLICFCIIMNIYRMSMRNWYCFDMIFMSGIYSTFKPIAGCFGSIYHWICLSLCLSLDEFIIEIYHLQYIDPMAILLDHKTNTIAILFKTNINCVTYVSFFVSQHSSWFIMPSFHMAIILHLFLM